MNEPVITFLSSLMLLGGIQGLYLAILLLSLRKSNFAANRYLATILAALGLTMLHQFLVDSGYVLYVPVLLGITMPLDLIYPPTLYLYVRTMTLPFAAEQRYKLHYLPSIVGIFLLLPFYLIDFDTKLNIVQSNYMLGWTGIMNITYPIAVLIMGIQFTVYLILCFKLLFQHTKTITQFFSYKENITLSWLRNLLLLMVVFWFFMLIFFFIYYKSAPDVIEQSSQLFIWLYGFSIVMVFYIGSMGLLQRRIYNPDKKIPELKPIITQNNTNGSLDAVSQSKSEKYKKSALTDEISKHILDKLTKTMEQDKPYLENNLTLHGLAKKIPTSANYLSQVINEQLQMNFFDYINSYRIEMAKELIINPLPHTHTILDIAMESAFNSKSAFYTAFKKQMGITPAQFKKSHS